MGRLAMHVIERDGRYILRLADNESEVRKGFQARVWYDAGRRLPREARPSCPTRPGAR